VQVAVPLLGTPERMHGEPVKVPTLLLLFQATVPEGVIRVPGDVSVTVAVHGVE
jgi:hypothetical protein